MEGVIPGKIGNAKALKILNLSCNYFTGSLLQGLFCLKELEQVELFGNGLCGEIKLEMENIVHLEEMVLSYNSFEGNLPENIANLEHLELVQLHGNNLIS